MAKHMLICTIYLLIVEMFNEKITNNYEHFTITDKC